MTWKLLLETGALMREAMASEHGESYRTISKGESYTVGVGARAAGGRKRYFLEVTVQLCGPAPSVDIGSIEVALPLLRELRSKGYSLECREGSISCERLLAAQELAAELKLVSAAARELK